MSFKILDQIVSRSERTCSLHEFIVEERKTTKNGLPGNRTNFPSSVFFGDMQDARYIFRLDTFLLQISAPFITTKTWDIPPPDTPNPEQGRVASGRRPALSYSEPA
jgi:hypothetical protein